MIFFMILWFLIWIFYCTFFFVCNVLKFDGIGGSLAHAGHGYIIFDLAERWTYGIKSLDINNKNNERVSNINGPKTLYIVQYNQ